MRGAGLRIFVQRPDAGGERPLDLTERHVRECEVDVPGRGVAVEEETRAIHRAVVVERDRALVREDRVDGSVEIAEERGAIELGCRITRVERGGAVERGQRLVVAADLVERLRQIAVMQREARLEDDRGLKRAQPVLGTSLAEGGQTETHVRVRGGGLGAYRVLAGADGGLGFTSR